MRRKLLLLLLSGLLLFSQLNTYSFPLAPNNLEIIIGQYVKGDYRYFVDFSAEPDLEILSNWTICVEKEVNLTDIDENLLLISWLFNISSVANSYNYNPGQEWKETYLVNKTSRELVIPIAEYDYRNGTVHFKASMLDYSEFAKIRNFANLVISFDNGSTKLWTEINRFDFTSENNYDFNVFLTKLHKKWYDFSCFPERTMYAISPDTNIGQVVDYGWYNGTIIEEKAMIIDSKNLIAKRCHVPRTTVYVNNDPNKYGIGKVEHDLYYDSETGFILKLNFSYSGTEGLFLATEFYIPIPNTETTPFQTKFIPVMISSLTLILSVFVMKRLKIRRNNN